MKALIDVVHILLCNSEHVYDMMKIVERKEGFCYYYLECDIAGSSDLPDHIRWSKIVEKFKTQLNLKSDQEALDFIKEAVRISQELRELVDNNDNRLNFIKGLVI